MKQLFINLPVKNVAVSMNFYTQLGFTVNPLFTFDDQKCMAWTDQVYVMLQTLDMSKKGETKNIADPKENRIATFTLPVESLDKMNEIMKKGLEAGGTEPTALIDEGFLQLRNIEDPDGHNWGILFLDIEIFKNKTGR